MSEEKRMIAGKAYMTKALLSRQDQLPLLRQLALHKEKEKQSFHVPGHKNGTSVADFFGANADFLVWDQTEVTGLDYLHDATGILLESQQLLSELYHSQVSHFLVNGSTVGNLAMILGCLKAGDTVLVDEQAHQSVHHGLQLAQAQAVFLAGEQQEILNLRTGPSLVTLKQQLLENKDTKAIILTYPTYDGECYEIAELIDYAHEQGVLVLVDEAHGAHFVLGEAVGVPTSALDLGADVVVQSAHKMLPAMTQAAFLHVGSTDRGLQEKIHHYLRMLQSSSPSYLLMASLEYARYFLAHYTAADWLYTQREIADWCVYFETLGFSIYHPADPLKKLIFHSAKTGFEIQEELEQHGFFVERATAEFVLLTFPFLKAEAGECLEQALLKQDRAKIGRSAGGNLFAGENCTWIRLENGIGKKAGEMLIPYPPGIPLLLVGEVIQEEHILQIKQLLEQKIRIVGMRMEEGLICVFKD